MRKKHEDEDDDEELHAGFGNSRLENKSSQQMTDEKSLKNKENQKVYTSAEFGIYRWNKVGHMHHDR